MIMMTPSILPLLEGLFGLVSASSKFIYMLLNIIEQNLINTLTPSPKQKLSSFLFQWVKLRQTMLVVQIEVKQIKYINIMIKSVAQTEPLPPTACKQSRDYGELSVSFSESRVGGDYSDGVGLLQCLMSSESAEIQRLNALVRLLTSKNQYLQKDNQILGNQIIFLNERLKQQQPHQQCNINKQQNVTEIINAFTAQLKYFEEKMVEQLQEVARRQLTLQCTVKQFREKVEKYRIKQQQRMQDDASAFRLQVQNTKLSVRVSELQKSLEQLSIKYVQIFQWRPYLIPEFKHLPQNITKWPRDDLRIDLRPPTQSQTATQNLYFK